MSEHKHKHIQIVIVYTTDNTVPFWKHSTIDSVFKTTSFQLCMVPISIVLIKGITAVANESASPRGMGNSVVQVYIGIIITHSLAWPSKWLFLLHQDHLLMETIFMKQNQSVILLQKPIRVETCNSLWFVLYKAFAHSFPLSTIFGKSWKKINQSKMQHLDYIQSTL